MDNRIDLGILGKYEIEDVVCEKEFDSDEEYDAFIKKLFDDYKNNIVHIDNDILFEIYSHLQCCGYPLWEFQGNFKRIVDEEKLPNDFWEITDDEKEEVLYGFEFNKDNILENIKNNIPFFNVEKLKNDIKITNVNIDGELDNIYIEFEGICNCFYAMIEMNYGNNFKIIDFHAS